MFRNRELSCKSSNVDKNIMQMAIFRKLN
jgi:hypothetical protein